MPKHHPRHPHHHPHHHHHKWFINAEMSDLSPEAVAKYMVGIGEKIASDGKVKVNGEEVSFPPKGLGLVVRYERAPKGELVFKVEMKWEDFHDDNELISSDSIEIG